MAEHIRMPRTDLADQWEQDLHPDQSARSQDETTAYDFKALHRRLHDMDDGVLKEIPVLSAGTRLEPGAIYINLADQEPREFRAKGDEVADAHHAYVPKNEVDYVVWNLLIGVDNPERLDMGNQT